MRLHLFCLCFLLVSLFPFPKAVSEYLSRSTSAHIQSRNTIRGRITDTSGNAIERVRIELRDEVEMTIGQTYSDAAGRYLFSGLSFGTFIIRVNSDGRHVPRSMRVMLQPTRVSGGLAGAQNEEVDFVLPTLDEARNKGDAGNSGVAFAQEVPENARKLYEKAVNLFEQKKTEDGVETLKEALKLFMDYYLAWERLGIEYTKLELYDAAKTALTQAVRVNESSANSFYALGYTQHQLLQWKDAATSLRRSLQLAPTSPNAAFAHYYLGLALLKEKNLTEGETHLKQARDMGRNNNNLPAEVHLQLAQIYSNSQRYKEAADELELYLKRASKAKDAENIRSLIKQLRAKATK
jgi:Tfp pilus assembly protein PilF